PLPGLLVELVEEARAQLGLQSVTTLGEALTQTSKQAAARLGFRELIARIVGRGAIFAALTQVECFAPAPGHRAAGYAASVRASSSTDASSSCERRREITLVVPLLPMLTPYRTSAASMVRFWWVTITNWARPENRRTSCRNRSMLASSSAASTSS